MLPHNMSLPFMLIILVLIVVFLCMMGYFHLWFACNKRYRNKYLKEHPPQTYEEIKMQTFKPTTDPSLFQVQDTEKKRVDEINDFSLI